MKNIVAVDIGGTFTDLVVCDTQSGRLSYVKSPTTYDNFANAIFDCVRQAKVDLSDTNYFKHGTTLVINALLQRRGARTALITTKGFRDVLEIGRGNRTRPFDLRFRRDEALISRELRFEVAERMTAAGTVRTPVNYEDLDIVLAHLREARIEAVAISFLNAYANTAHEDAVALYVKDRLPGVFVTSGTQLTREWFEYERTATASANAFVGPTVTAYVGRMADDLKSMGCRGPLMLMGSHGGVLSAERALRQPIALVESGPVGGCIGAAKFGGELGFSKLIAFDMGGTTAKCCLIEDGEFAIESVYHVGGFERGIPIRESVVDILEVGAGGGSIASVDLHGRLLVGPRSAGSTPGPVCYGRGGAEPTVTDANLVLGRIDADYFLGGEMKLDAVATRHAIDARIAKPLHLTGQNVVTTAAAGILTIANLTMADAIKRISVGRGRDPREFVLFCYGGGGPLHGVELARELNIPIVVVPPEPGTFSASGMLYANAKVESVHTVLAELDSSCMDLIATLQMALKQELQQAMLTEFGKTPSAFEVAIECRYKGQSHSLRIPLDIAWTAEETKSHFHVAYRKRFGHAHPTHKVECVGVRIEGILHIESPGARGQAPAHGADAGNMRRGLRDVYFPEAGFLPTPVFDRYQLPVGFSINGPAIIEEYGSTAVVGPGDELTVGAQLELRIVLANLSGAIP